jgi:hypothetical protein
MRKSHTMLSQIQVTSKTRTVKLRKVKQEKTRSRMRRKRSKISRRIMNRKSSLKSQIPTLEDFWKRL